MLSTNVAGSNMAFMASFVLATPDDAIQSLENIAAHGGCVSTEVIDAFATELNHPKIRGRGNEFSRSIRDFRNAAGEDEEIIPLSNNIAPVTEQLSALNGIQYRTIGDAARKVMQKGAKLMLGSERVANSSLAESLRTIATQHAMTMGPLGGNAFGKFGIAVMGGSIFMGRELRIDEIASYMKAGGIDETGLRTFLKALLQGRLDGQFLGIDIEPSSVITGSTGTATNFKAHILAPHEAPFQEISRGTMGGIDRIISQLYAGATPKDGHVMWITTGRKGALLKDGSLVLNGPLALSEGIPSSLAGRDRRERNYVRIPIVFHEGKPVIRRSYVRGPHNPVILKLLIEAWGFKIDASESQTPGHVQFTKNPEMEALFNEAVEFIDRMDGKVAIPSATLARTDHLIEAALKSKP